MKVKSFAVGDVFLHSDGHRLAVTSIFCEYNDDDSRWETSVGTAYAYNGGEIVEETTKAWVFVKVVSDPSFHTQTPGGIGTTSPSTMKGAAKSPMAADFLRKAPLYGLDPSDLGKAIRLSSGKRVTIVGCKPRNHKYPIIVEGSQGGRWKISTVQAKQALQKAALSGGP